jgi:hypothetical protein
MRFYDWPRYINDAALRSSYAYKTNHSIFMYGDDFSHTMAWSSYQGMEDVIACTEALYPNVKVKFSTISEYLEAVKAENVYFPDYTSDFLPYSQTKDSFWSGYYTSRPAFKMRVRRFTNDVRSIQNLAAL